MDDYELNKRHALALEKIQRQDDIVRQRDQDREYRKTREQAEAARNEYNLALLQHDLDVEKLAPLHQFNRAEGLRQIEEEATLAGMRLRHEAIRQLWVEQEDFRQLEGDILKMILRSKLDIRQIDAKAKNDLTQSMLDHKNNLTQSELDHKQEMERFGFERRLEQTIRNEDQKYSTEDILNTLKELDKP